MTTSTNSPWQRCDSLVEVLRRRATELPNQVAFTFLADGETEQGTITYDALDRQARAIAATLQAQELTGERALLLYPPGLDYIAAFFGCLYAGVIAVPAYPPRRNRSLDRLHAIATDAKAAVVLTTPAVSAMVERTGTEAASLQSLPWLLSDRYAPEAAHTWHAPTLTKESLAFLQYTSGSTAAPKGVMLTHGNLLHNCDWVHQRFEHTAQSHGVIWLPPYHDMGLIGGILQPLYTGSPCWLMSPVTMFSSPFAWLQAISRYRGVTSGGPNFAYDLCVRKVTPEQRATLDLSSWRVAFTGAEPIRAATLERFAEVFAPCGFRKEAFYPCYGLAEATLMASGGKAFTSPRSLSIRKTDLEANRVEVTQNDDPGSQTFIGCGERLSDQQMLIVHPETLTRCPPQQVGEIWIAGPSVAKGYWDQPQETRAVFEAHLADSGEGPFLRTGDLGFLYHGELYVTGRLKNLIIVRGRNLYPQDLELTAEQSHPDLQPGSGAAFSIEEDGQERLVLAYEVIPRRQPDMMAVGQAVQHALAEEHEVELHHLVLLKPGSIPKTSSGKIQHRACRQAFLAGTLEVLGQWRANTRPAEEAITRATILALSPRVRQERLELHFREQFARLLHLEPAAVNLHQPVNTLGLDSLTTVELKHTLERTFGVALPVTSFLQGASLAQLATQVIEQMTAPPDVAAQENMTSLVHRLQQLSDDQVKTLLETDKVSV
jgi:acyl-CoA synthetase (AMP-forming)/AMP-acid ligase II/acyl carrier protein